MAYMMDSMMGGYFGYPFIGWGFGLLWFILFLVIAYFVYRDAENRRMNGLLWAILIIIPMAGLLFLVLYLVIRESNAQNAVPENSQAMTILRDRYAKGELTADQFNKMSSDLNSVTRESIWDHPEPDSSNAMDILTGRYARGEINGDQFKKMSNDLKNLNRDVWKDPEPEMLNPLNILRERYARGEISGEQFSAMREELKKE